MKFRMIIDRDREEEVVIYAHEKTKLIEDIEALVLGNTAELIGYTERSTVKLDANDVMCFSVENGKIYALTKNEKLRIKLRLYQIEEMLSDGFVKINQSCVANIKMIERFESSFSGAIQVRFKNGYTDYVSRRQLKTVKERLGF